MLLFHSPDPKKLFPCPVPISSRKTWCYSRWLDVCWAVLPYVGPLYAGDNGYTESDEDEKGAQRNADDNEQFFYESGTGIE